VEYYLFTKKQIEIENCPNTSQSLFGHN
jgi:hypothetical protein